eukprot:14254316-Heterocapsa_arctica.AAC.1
MQNIRSSIGRRLVDRNEAPAFTPLDGFQDLVDGSRALVQRVSRGRRVGAEHGRADSTSQWRPDNEEQAPADS